MGKQLRWSTKPQVTWTPVGSVQVVSSMGGLSRDTPSHPLMGLMQIFQEFSITIQQKMRFFHFRKAPWGFPFVPSGDGFKLTLILMIHYITLTIRY